MKKILLIINGRHLLDARGLTEDKLIDNAPRSSMKNSPPGPWRPKRP